MNFKSNLYALIAFLLFGCLFAEEGDKADNWPTWRGPASNGIAENASPPIEWSEEKNIKWKVEIPGSGHATPVIWQDKIFVLTAVKTGKVFPRKAEGTSKGERPRPKNGEKPPRPPKDVKKGEKPPEGKNSDGKKRKRRSRGVQPDEVLRYTVLALDRETGKTLWEHVAIEAAPHEGTHLDATWASNSPVTDGEHLYAHFGSRGIFCYTLEGELVWQKDLGDMRTRRGFGEGSSPVLHGNTLVINWDHEEASFIVALDKNTGDELWRDARDEPTSWSTPLIQTIDGKEQVIVSATNNVVGYDLQTGKRLWESNGMTMNVIPTPIVHKDLLYVMSGFRGNALQAIRMNGLSGDIKSSDAIAWEYNKDTPYVPSGVQYNGRLYFSKSNNAILTCLDAMTGKPVYETQRLSGLGTIYSSMIAANGHVYITSKNGTTLVLKDGETFDVAATNKLDDFFSASPVAVGSSLFLRGTKNLYCISAN